MKNYTIIIFIKTGASSLHSDRPSYKITIYNTLICNCIKQHSCHPRQLPLHHEKKWCAAYELVRCYTDLNVPLFQKKCQCDPVAVFCLKLHLLAFAHPMQSPGHHSRLAWVGMLKGNFSASWPLQTLTWLFAHIKNDKLLWINWVIKSILALPGTSHQPPLPYLIQQWRIWLVDIWCRSDFNFLSKSCDLTQGG